MDLGLVLFSSLYNYWIDGWIVFEGWESWFLSLYSFIIVLYIVIIQWNKRDLCIYYNYYLYFFSSIEFIILQSSCFLKHSVIIIKHSHGCQSDVHSIIIHLLSLPWSVFQVHLIIQSSVLQNDTQNYVSSNDLLDTNLQISHKLF